MFKMLESNRFNMLSIEYFANDTGIEDFLESHIVWRISHDMPDAEKLYLNLAPVG